MIRIYDKHKKWTTRKKRKKKHKKLRTVASLINLYQRKKENCRQSLSCQIQYISTPTHHVAGLFLFSSDWIHIESNRVCLLMLESYNKILKVQKIIYKGYDFEMKIDKIKNKNKNKQKKKSIKFNIKCFVKRCSFLFCNLQFG